MSMVSTLAENLRAYAEEYKYLSNHTRDNNIPDILLVAADTIEELSAKAARQNMERSSQYYGGGWISVNDCLPPQPTENKTLDYKPLELYLVYVNGDDYPFRAFWNGKFFADGIAKVENVSYWMPMPLPPTYEPKEDKYE